MRPTKRRTQVRKLHQKIHRNKSYVYDPAPHPSRPSVNLRCPKLPISGVSAAHSGSVTSGNRRVLTMKTKLNYIPLIALLLASCATITPGSDPVVVNAERFTAVAADTFDLFVHTEYDNRAYLATVDPHIHTYANFIRVNAKSYLQSARTMTKAFKANRSPENKANLTTALAVLTAAIGETQKYLVKATPTNP